jgi:hypothetical protein
LEPSLDHIETVLEGGDTLVLEAENRHSVTEAGL